MIPTGSHPQLIVKINKVLTIEIDPSLYLMYFNKAGDQVCLFVVNYLAVNKIPFWINKPCHNKAIL